MTFIIDRKINRMMSIIVKYFLISSMNHQKHIVVFELEYLKDIS